MKATRRDVNGPKVRMLGHCVICVRKISPALVVGKRTFKGEQLGSGSTCSSAACDLLEQVPRAEFKNGSTAVVNISSLLSTLNKFWARIQGRRENGTEPGGDVQSENCGASDFFWELPELCHFCGEKLANVDKMLRDLLEIVDKLGSIAGKAKRGGELAYRGESFVRKLTGSCLEAASIRHTLELLGMVEGKNAKMEAAPRDTGPPSPLVASRSSVHSSVPYPLAHYSSYTDTFDDHRGGDQETPVSKDDQPEPEFAHENESSEDELEEDSKWPAVKQENEDDDNEPGDYIKSEVELKEEDDYTETSSDSENEAGDGDDDTMADEQVDSNEVASSNTGTPPPETPSITGPDGFPLYPTTQKCDLCKARYATKNILEHVRSHVGDSYLIKCPNQECRYIFSQPRSVTDHLKSSICGDHVSAEEKKAIQDSYTICEICGMGFPRKMANLKRHLLREHQHSDDLKYPCPFSGCHESFTFKQTAVLHLSHHQFVNANSIQQRCPLCKCYYKVEQMEAHLKTNHQSSEVIKCTHCPFLFPNRKLFLDHLRLHRSDALFCDICNDGVQYAFHAKLRRHYFDVHKIGHVFPCEQCDSVFFSVDSLKGHVRDQHKKKQQESTSDLDPPPSKKAKENVTFRCKDCGQKWKSQERFKIHNRNSYVAEPVKCRFCDEKFSKRCLLEQHERAEHNDQLMVPKVKPKFQCDFPGCGKEFDGRARVKAHKSVVHEGVRSHVCEYCGKAFAYGPQLKQHMNRIHLGIKPHVCEFCGQGFISTHALQEHKRIHRDERPFSCEICGHAFKQSASLKKHLDGHRMKGADFKPKGPLKVARKRVARKT